jgi:hypothetical protein
MNPNRHRAESIISRAPRRLLMSVLSLLLLALMAQTAAAGPLTWTLQNVTSLGTTITGTFVYNADTDVFSHIDITTTGGSVIPDETWTNKASFGSFDCCLALVDTSGVDDIGANVLNLVLAGFLTDAGGTVPLSETQQGTCGDSGCNSYLPYANDPSGGTNTNVTGDVFASGAAVPEPLPLALLGVGLLGMVALRRRSKADATAWIRSFIPGLG